MEGAIQLPLISSETGRFRVRSASLMDDCLSLGCLREGGKGTSEEFGIEISRLSCGPDRVTGTQVEVDLSLDLGEKNELVGLVNRYVDVATASLPWAGGARPRADLCRCLGTGLRDRDGLVFTFDEIVEWPGFELGCRATISGEVRGELWMTNIRLLIGDVDLSRFANPRCVIDPLFPSSLAWAERRLLILAVRCLISRAAHELPPKVHFLGLQGFMTDPVTSDTLVLLGGKPVIGTAAPVILTVLRLTQLSPTRVMALVLLEHPDVEEDEPFRVKFVYDLSRRPGGPERAIEWESERDGLTQLENGALAILIREIQERAAQSD